MQTLFLDLASNQGSIACVADDRVLATTTINHRINDSELTGLLVGTLEKAGWTFKDLTQIACVIGPGGFTSLRVGAAAANALAFALKIPAAGIRLWELYENRVAEKKCVWIHSTKKTQMFVHRFGDAGEPQCIDLTALSAHVKSGDHYTGELIPEHQKIAAEIGLVESKLAPIDEVLPQFLGLQIYKNETLVPWYGRGW